MTTICATRPDCSPRSPSRSTRSQGVTPRSPEATTSLVTGPPAVSGPRWPVRSPRRAPGRAAGPRRAGTRRGRPAARPGGERVPTGRRRRQRLLGWRGGGGGRTQAGAGPRAGQRGGPVAHRTHSGAGRRGLGDLPRGERHRGMEHRPSGRAADARAGQRRHCHGRVQRRRRAPGRDGRLRRRQGRRGLGHPVSGAGVGPERAVQCLRTPGTSRCRPSGSTAEPPSAPDPSPIGTNPEERNAVCADTPGDGPDHTPCRPGPPPGTERPATGGARPSARCSPHWPPAITSRLPFPTAAITASAYSVKPAESSSEGRSGATRSWPSAQLSLDQMPVPANISRAVDQHKGAHHPHRAGPPGPSGRLFTAWGQSFTA